jgi:hypothetical protein
MGRARTAALVWVCLLGCLLASTALFAQKITGDIEGNVTDSSGAVVPRASVTATNVDTGLVRTANTSGSGNYRINDLAIGNYKITAEAAGFKTVVRAATIQAGALTHADFSLTVGQRTETVEVEGTAPSSICRLRKQLRRSIEN